MTTSTIGFSETAQSLQAYRRQQQARWRDAESFGLRSELREELGDVWDECRVPNWDGHGAIPVSKESVRHAYEFLELLPVALPAPSLSAEPCGELTLEWYVSPHRLLSVSVSDEGELHCAALLGPNRMYGTEVLQGQVPRAIVELIQKVHRR